MTSLEDDERHFRELTERMRLHFAAQDGDLKEARELIEQGFDVNAHLEEKAGDTPLGDVAGNCSYEMAELLIKAGANPTIPGWMGLSALDHASGRKRKEGVRVYELLLETAKKKFHWGE